MPPKQTPYQFKKGLTYVKQVPRFLQGLTSQTNNSDDDKQIQEANEDTDSDDEFNAAREEERPQIIVLKEGKHMSEQEVKAYLDSKAKSKEEISSTEDKESGIDEDTPVVDEKTGKILFRKPKTKKTFASKSTNSETVIGSYSNAKNESNMPIKSINKVIDDMKRKRDDNEIENDKLRKKAKSTKKKSQSRLSFNDDEI